MARIASGEIHLTPMTLKVDPELKIILTKLSGHERRTPSAAGAVLLQYGVLRWSEEGTLQRLIDEVDKKWARGGLRGSSRDR